MSAEPAGDVCRSHLAYLEDRICVAEHRPQRFGTQFPSDDKGGGLEPEPIDDPEKLDERRATAGLEPFAVYRDHMRQLRRPTRTSPRSGSWGHGRLSRLNSP